MAMTSKATWTLVAVVAAGLAGCATGDGAMAEKPPGEMATGGAPVDPDLPMPESPAAKTQRLRDVENTLDLWYAATQRQEYDSRDSFESVLHTYCEEHFDVMVSDLRHGNQRYQRAMAGALGFSLRPEAVPPLMDALRSEYYEVVLHALLSLYHLARAGVPVDPEPVLPYLGHPHEAVRSNAALVLSKAVGPHSPRSVLLPIIGATADKDPATRIHALGALAATEDREAFPHLVKALHDPVPLARVRAAFGLGRLNLPEAIPYLIDVLRRTDETNDVKLAAARSLGALTGEKENVSTDAAEWERIASERKG